MIRLSSMRFRFDDGFVAEDGQKSLAEMLQPSSWDVSQGPDLHPGDWFAVIGSDGWTFARVKEVDHDGRPTLDPLTIKAPAGVARSK